MAKTKIISPRPRFQFSFGMFLTADCSFPVECCLLLLLTNLTQTHSHSHVSHYRENVKLTTFITYHNCLISSILL